MRYIVVSLCVCLCVSLSYGLQAVPGGMEGTLQYDEPDINADGTPLTDLDHTTIYSDYLGDFQKLYDVPASTATGGNTINQDIFLPLPDGMHTISFYATATDLNENTSEPSETITEVIDLVPPGESRFLVVADGNLYFSYREPTVNADGSPLTDLADAKVFYNDTQSAALRLIGEFGVSGPNGGGLRTVSFPLSTFTPGSTIRLYLRFYDTMGNASKFPLALGIKLP